MWFSNDFALTVTVRFDLDTLTEGGTVARCALVLPAGKVIDVGHCRIRKKVGRDGFAELKLTNVESGLTWSFIRVEE